MWCSARDGPLCTYYNLNIPPACSRQAALTCVHPNLPPPLPGAHDVPSDIFIKLISGSGPPWDQMNYWQIESLKYKRACIVTGCTRPMCQVSQSLSFSWLSLHSPDKADYWHRLLSADKCEGVAAPCYPAHTSPWNSDKETKIWRKQWRWSLHTLTPL